MSLIQRIRAAFAPKNAGASISDLAAMQEMFGLNLSPSGHAVTDKTAMRVTTVYACISKIAGAVSQLPINLYKNKGADGDELLARQALWWRLNESPHGDWTSASWKEWMVLCTALRGDAFTLIERDSRITAGGAIVGLKPLHPDDVRTYRDSDWRIAYAVMDRATGKIRAVAPDDILHITGLGFDGLRSYSVIQHAANVSIGNALAANDFAGRTFQDGAMAQVALKYPKQLNEGQADMIRKSFAATYGGTAGRRFPLVLPEGADVSELSINPADAQMLESRQFEREEICHAFGVPPILIGDSTKASSWGTGIEQISIAFVRYTIKPMLKRWEEELNRKLFRQAPNFLRFELTELLRGDAKAQSEYYRAALGGPGSGDAWMTINEVRATQNLPPVQTGNEIYANPKVTQ